MYVMFSAGIHLSKLLGGPESKVLLSVIWHDFVD